MSNHESGPLVLKAELVPPAFVEQKHQAENIVGATRPSLLVQHYAPESIDESPDSLGWLEELMMSESLGELSFKEISERVEDFELYSESFDFGDEYDSLKDTFIEMRQVARLLCEAEQMDGTSDLRVGYIKDLIEDFRVMNPDASFYDDHPGSASDTEDFLGFYAHAITARLTEEKWAEKIDGWRERYVEALDSPKLKSLVPADVRRRFADDARKAPVRVTDPITSILNGKERGSEIFGSMDPNDRTVSVDPFSANHVMNREARRLTELYGKVSTGALIATEEGKSHNERVLQTLFHELIHYGTNEYYRHILQKNLYDDYRVEERITIEQSWPQFWFEGMTEKLAQLMTSEVIDASALPRDRTLKENSYWKEMSIGPRQIGTTRKTGELTNKIPVSYPEYRILIDTLFSRLDWQAAGLKPDQAEKLAFRAFTDRVMPGGTSGVHRLRFIEAINKAAHPGFWMKLTTLVDSYGPGLVTDMLSDPKFDVHEPADTPWLASPLALRGAEYHASDKYLSEMFAPLKRMRDLDAGDAVIWNAERNFASAEKVAENARMLLAAHAGLRTILEQRHKQRTAPSPADRLQASIFGGRAGMQLKERPLVDTTPARSAVEAWVKSLNEDE